MIGYARENNLAIVFVILIVNGIAEELFFRGALFAAIGVRHPVLISTVIYCLATVAGGNPVLVFAAAVLGTVVGWQRRAGGGVLGADPHSPHLVDRPCCSRCRRSSPASAEREPRGRSSDRPEEARRSGSPARGLVRPRCDCITSATTRASTPATIRMRPSVLSLKKGMSTFSANKKIAPTTIRRIPRPIPMCTQ